MDTRTLPGVHGPRPVSARRTFGEHRFSWRAGPRSERTTPLRGLISVRACAGHHVRREGTADWGETSWKNRRNQDGWAGAGTRTFWGWIGPRTSMRLQRWPRTVRRSWRGRSPMTPRSGRTCVRSWGNWRGRTWRSGRPRGRRPAGGGPPVGRLQPSNLYLGASLLRAQTPGGQKPRLCPALSGPALAQEPLEPLADPPAL